ncbi:MAG: nucleotidyltransferase domain-containing protein [Bacteroidia bacterium]|nr:nucleotidyltransferase domain-containing protein [Bacteroidia bacterium]
MSGDIIIISVESKKIEKILYEKITKLKNINKMQNNKEKIQIILSEIIEKLKSEYKPLKIILFGSYAYGNPTEDSDIDLLILKNTNKRRVDRFVQVKRIIYNPNHKIPVSPLIYTPSELEERLKIGDDFIKEIIQKGKIFYDKTSS